MILRVLVFFLLIMIGVSLFENQVQLKSMCINALLFAATIWVLLDTSYVIKNDEFL